jgi:hypothetical protein
MDANKRGGYSSYFVVVNVELACQDCGAEIVADVIAIRLPLHVTCRGLASG